MLAALLNQAERRGGLHVFRVFHRRLGAASAPPQSPGLECRRLSGGELLSLCADPALELREAMVRAALARGDACVGAFLEGRLAGYAWFAYDEAPHVNGVRVQVPARAIYRFKTFVRPACRGRGIAPFLYAAADAIVARPGRESVVNCIALQNRASIAASLKSGDAAFGYLAYWQARGCFFALHSRRVAALGLRFCTSS
jgi:GNAT superfamily N-acetyltransferase